MRQVVGVVLAGLLVGGCGAADPNSPEARRQALFKQMLVSSEELGGMLRGRLAHEPERFAAGAGELNALAAQPWQYFPPPDGGARSTAKPEVWQQHARFQALAQALQAATARLQRVSSQPQVAPAELGRAFAEVEAACKRCHESFRAY